MNFSEGVVCDLDSANNMSLQAFNRFRRRKDVCSPPKAGETSLPGDLNDKDDLGFHEFIKENPLAEVQPNPYPIDEGVCPPAIFGRSNIPVCEEIGYTVIEAEPGHNYFNLLDVYIRTSSLNGSVFRF